MGVVMHPCGVLKVLITGDVGDHHEGGYGSPLLKLFSAILHKVKLFCANYIVCSRKL